MQLSSIYYFVFMSFLTVCSCYQREVDFVEPCNDGQQHTVGKDDVLYMATGLSLLKPSCQASIKAGVGCSKLCFSVKNVKFSGRCEITFTASSGLSSDEADYKAHCGEGKVGDTWCSKGPLATFEMKSANGFYRDMQYDYKMNIMVTAQCSDVYNTLEQEIEVSDEEDSKLSLPQGAFIGAIIGACVASIVGTSLIFLLVYFLCVKRKQESEMVAQYQNPRYAPVPDGSMAARS